MKARHGRTSRTNSRHDNTAIVANNCNNLIIAVLASAWGTSDCRTN